MLLAISSDGIKFGENAASIGGGGRILMSYQTLRDMIAAGIYIAMLGAQVALWAMWQKRGQKPSTELATSEFGRPLVRKT
jgi:hypothetical protein